MLSFRSCCRLLFGEVPSVGDRLQTNRLMSASEAVATRALSAVDQKNIEFLREAYLRQGWEDFSQLFPDDALARLQRSAVIVFKPEAIVGRRVRKALAYLAEHDFSPASWTWIQLTRHSINAIWRFQWNVATLDRLDLAEDLYCRGKSLFVVLEDRKPELGLPATTRLRKLKGPAQPELRNPGHLRFAVNAPNRMMSIVHAPDEPIDIVRECGIHFAGNERRDVIASLFAFSGGSSTPLRELLSALDQIERTTTSNPLDWFSSLDAFKKQSRSIDAGEILSRQREVSSIHTNEGDSRIWPSLANVLDSDAPSLDPWDRLTIGAELVSHDVPGETCTIDDDGVPQWESGLGCMVSAAR